MIAGIHQPNFVPWLGYFYKIAQCDVFIILDDVQFTKNSFINRNRIKTPQGELWLTLAVDQSGKFGQTINETQLKNKEQLLPKLLRTLQMNYNKAPWFKIYFPKLEALLQEEENNLAAINIRLIRWICEELKITTPLQCASALTDIQGESTARLISICEHIGADKYLSGFGGNKYQEQELYAAHHIELQTSQFVHPVYKQPWGDFMPNLSVLDVLFNCGDETATFVS